MTSVKHNGSETDIKRRLNHFLRFAVIKMHGNGCFGMFCRGNHQRADKLQGRLFQPDLSDLKNDRGVELPRRSEHAENHFHIRNGKRADCIIAFLRSRKQFAHIYKHSNNSLNNIERVGL